MQEHARQRRQTHHDRIVPANVARKRFTDAGIPTRLRFAHECNWYIKDGTYSGSLADCKSSFTTVAQTCRKIAPAVQMFLSPNVDGNGMSVCACDATGDRADRADTQLYPDDPSLVDVCGIDFCPCRCSRVC